MKRDVPPAVPRAVSADVSAPVGEPHRARVPAILVVPGRAVLPARVPRLRLVARAAGLVALWAGAVAVAGSVSVADAVHRVALLAHLVALVVGFGAVLAIDTYGLLWLVGRRSLAEVVRMAAGLDAMVWLGLAGLVASGVLLEPDLASPLTRVKLVLVLAVGFNGLNAHGLMGATAARPTAWASARRPGSTSGGWR